MTKSDDDLVEEVKALAVESPDIVEILRTMTMRHADFRERSFVSAVTVRDALGISVRQLNAVIGWLKGEVSDSLLVKTIPLGNRE